MSRISRLERRFGRFAIPNLTLFLIIGQGVLYVASYLPQGIDLEQVAMNPAKVMQGEVWRLATFLFMPPPKSTLVVFVIFYFALLHLFGNTLEQHWGAFRYNLYLLVGWLANVAAAFAGSAIIGEQFADLIGGEGMKMASVPASNHFLYLSLFLAFARLYPDFIINLFFVLPIKIKWLAMLNWAYFALSMVSGNWMTRMLVLATVANYLLFFGPEHARGVRHAQRKRSFQAKAKKATAAPKHVCRVCGLSSAESPKTLFRYCSKCAGQQCYCPDHIREHEHVTTEEEKAGAAR